MWSISKQEFWRYELNESFIMLLDQFGRTIRSQSLELKWGYGKVTFSHLNLVCIAYLWRF